MAEQITKKTRHLQKHDVEANWLKAVNFKPMPGEIIVYDKDEQHDFVRTKIGDGETYINDLPFVNNAIIDVASLPTEHINYEAVYRVIDTVVYDYGDPLYDPKVHYVDALPEEGEGVVNFDTDDLCFYYNGSDGLVYCYVDETLSAAAGADGMDLPVGWYPYDTFATFIGSLGTMILNVYTLPEQGMPAMNLDTGNSWIYYHIGENEAYCYINEVLSGFINNQFGMTISTGWYPYSQLSSLADINYQGIFTKREDIPDEGLSILVNNILYTYNDNWNQIGGTQIQADWDQQDDIQPDYIRNKPIIATPDWSVTSGPGIILNKPCGEVQAGIIVYSGSVECSSSFQGEYFTRGYYSYSPPKFLNGIEYRVVLSNGLDITVIATNDELRWNDNLSFFNSNHFELFRYNLNGSYNLQITINKSGSYQISSKYLPEGAKIGKGGSAERAEVFNDYQYNEASGYYSHAEGSDTTASGRYSHAEGSHTTASGDYSHAEGSHTTASGYYSHAEGSDTTASGDYSHAEGSHTTASGDYSHAEGSHTTASGNHQHVQGKYNIENVNGKYAHIVGNGTDNASRSNAHTLDWTGNAWFRGNVYVGGAGQDDTSAKRLLTEDDLPDNELPSATTEDNDKVLTVINGEPSWAEPASDEYNRINVRDMGAVGDGVTDDRAAILAAFDKAKTMLPCEVYFPAGTYGISNGMYFKMPLGSGGLRVRGAGRDTTTIQYLDSFPDSGQNWYALAIAPETSPAKEDEYLHDVSVMGLTIHDPDPCAKAWALAKGDPGQEETHGFGLNCIKRCSVTDCQVITAGDESINIYACHDVIVMNNHLFGCPGAGPGGGAIAICDGSVGVVVSNNTINGSAPDEVLENGTVIEKHNTGIEVESMEYPVRDVIIANNTVLNIQGTGIGMYAGSAGCAVHNVTITDNIITGCNVGIDTSGEYQKVGVIISNNNISDCAKLHNGNGLGISLAGSHTDVVVRGNTIRNTYAVGISVMSSADDSMVIENNIIKDAGTDAMFLSGKEFTIRDCTITNTGVGGSGSAAISRYGTSIIRVYGCRITGVRQVKGIMGATEVEDTTIEMVNADGNPVTDGQVLDSSPKRIVNCQLNGGYIAITNPNAVVQGVTLTCSQQYQPAIKVSASGVIVTGCHITHSKSMDCIKENGAVDGNLFINNVLTKGGITTVGANTVAMNMINGVWVDNTNKLPTVTANDNGKLLQVTNGEWAAISVTNGNEVAY